MLFTVDRNQNKKIQCVQIADISKQRLLGYAESLRELAKSLGGEFQGRHTDRQGILEEHKSWESRQIISSNLQEVAQVVSQVACQELQYQPLEERRRKILLHALRAEGIYAENMCYMPNEQGRKRIGMLLSTEKKGGIKAACVADMLSVLLRSRLQVSAASPYQLNREKQSFIFVEEARYIALTGYSKITKEDESFSGDSYSMLESEKGKLTVLLSDGTGSGEKAAEESEKVLDFMEKMLEAGFEVENAVRLINTALFAKTSENSHPTLDICDLDLYRGSCEIFKVGGAVTFLKKDGEVEQIAVENLPLGIFQQLEVQTVQRELTDGDLLVMMTDGVLDALEENQGEEIMSEVIRDMEDTNPQEIAEKLMHLVLCYSGGHIRDDMTILVIGVWES